MTDQDERDPRVYFAIEHTFLAWTRTGLALMTFGFVIARPGLFLKQMQSMGGGAAAQVPSSPAASLWIGTGAALPLPRIVGLTLLAAGVGLAVYMVTLE